MITLQPHSGAIMLAIYYNKKHPTIENFDIRMTSPKSKIYRVVLPDKNKDTIMFRTGKDYPCYSKTSYSQNGEKFSIAHDHSPVRDEFKISGKKLYMGDLTTEAGLRIKFDGEFITEKKLNLNENYQLPSGRSIYTTRSYEIDNKW